VEAAWPFRKRQISTPLQLFILCIAVLLPLLAFAGILASRYAQSERQQYYGVALDSARQINNAIDLDINGKVRALEILALSRALAAGEFAAFHEQTMRAEAILGAEITYKDLAGNELVNSGREFGPAAAGSLTAYESAAIDSSRAMVSDLQDDPARGESFLAVSVRVSRGEEVTGVLSLRLRPTTLVGLLQGAELPGAWTAAVVDGQGRIVARSKDHDRYVGVTASQDLRDNTTGREGVWRGTTIDGQPVLSAFARSALADWRVAVGVPVAAVEEPLRQTLLWLLVLGLVGLLASAAVAVVFGSAISRAMGILARLAADPENADRHPPPATALREVNAVGSALVQSARTLREQSEARDEAEAALAASKQRLERILATSPVGIIEVTEN